MYSVGALCVGKGANASQHENYVEKLYHTASGFLCAGARCDAGHHSPRSLHWQVAVDDDNKETGGRGRPRSSTARSPASVTEQG